MSIFRISIYSREKPAVYTFSFLCLIKFRYDKIYKRFIIFLCEEFRKVIVLIWKQELLRNREIKLR